jgi:hypothetical protein
MRKNLFQIMAFSQIELPGACPGVLFPHTPKNKHILKTEAKTAILTPTFSQY